MKTEEHMRTDSGWETRQLGRAKNAILVFLEKKLTVPKMYIDAIWDDRRVDILAVDRDGVGDVHVVRLLPLNIPKSPARAVTYLVAMIPPVIERFNAVSAQYKYIATVDVSPNSQSSFPGIPHFIADSSFAEDGIGRVGCIAVDFLPDGEPQARTIIKPERFRAKVAKLADEYVQQHEADWEIRA